VTIRPVSKDDKLTLLFYLFVRQMGGLADCLRHIQGGKQNTECDYAEYKAWVAYAKSELADVGNLVRKACDVLDLKYDEVISLGTLRDEEKKKEYLRRHPNATWM